MQVMSAYERSYTRAEHNMHASVRPFVAAAQLLASALTSRYLVWSGHSMGCYLLLNVIDRLQYEGGSSGGGDAATLVSMFPRMILSAPDVPTWCVAAQIHAQPACSYFT